MKRTANKKKNAAGVKAAKAVSVVSSEFLNRFEARQAQIVESAAKLR